MESTKVNVNKNEASYKQNLKEKKEIGNSYRAFKQKLDLKMTDDLKNELPFILCRRSHFSKALAIFQDHNTNIFVNGFNNTNMIKAVPYDEKAKKQKKAELKEKFRVSRKELFKKWSPGVYFFFPFKNGKTHPKTEGNEDLREAFEKLLDDKAIAKLIKVNEFSHSFQKKLSQFMEDIACSNKRNALVLPAVNDIDSFHYLWYDPITEAAEMLLNGQAEALKPRQCHLRITYITIDDFESFFNPFSVFNNESFQYIKILTSAEGTLNKMAEYFNKKASLNKVIIPLFQKDLRLNTAKLDAERELDDRETLITDAEFIHIFSRIIEPLLEAYQPTLIIFSFTTAFSLKDFAITEKGIREAMLIMARRCNYKIICVPKYGAGEGKTSVEKHTQPKEGFFEDMVRIARKKQLKRKEDCISEVTQLSFLMEIIKVLKGLDCAYNSKEKTKLDYLDHPNYFWTSYIEKLAKELSQLPQLLFLKRKSNDSKEEFIHHCKKEYSKAIAKENKGFFSQILEINQKEKLKNLDSSDSRTGKKLIRGLMKNSLRKSITVFNENLQSTEEIFLSIKQDNREMDLYYNQDSISYYVRYVPGKVYIILINVEIGPETKNFIFQHSFRLSNPNKQTKVLGIPIPKIFEESSNMLLCDFSLCYDEQREALYVIWGRAANKTSGEAPRNSEMIYKLDLDNLINKYQPAPNNINAADFLPREWSAFRPSKDSASNHIHRYGVSSAFCNNKIYLFGGSSLDSQLYNSNIIEALTMDEEKSTYSVLRVEKSKYAFQGYRPYDKGIAITLTNDKILVLGSIGALLELKNEKSIIFQEFDVQNESFAVIQPDMSGDLKDYDLETTFKGPSLNIYKEAKAENISLSLLTQAIKGRKLKQVEKERLKENERKRAITNFVKIEYKQKESAVLEFKLKVLPKVFPPISCSYRSLVQFYSYFRDYEEGNMFFFEEKTLRIWSTDSDGNTLIMIQLGFPSTQYLNSKCKSEVGWITSSSVKKNNLYMKDGDLYIYFSSAAETNNEPIIYSIKKKEVLNFEQWKKDPNILFKATKQTGQHLNDRKDLVGIHKRSMIVDDKWLYLIGGHRDSEFEEMQKTPEVIELEPQIPMNIRISLSKPYDEVHSFTKNIRQMNDPYLSQTNNLLLALENHLTVQKYKINRMEYTSFKIFGEFILKKDIYEKQQPEWKNLEIEFNHDQSTKLLEEITHTGKLKIVYSGLMLSKNGSFHDEQTVFQMKMLVYLKKCKEKMRVMQKYYFLLDEIKAQESDCLKVQAILENETLEVEKNFCERVPNDFSTSNPLKSRPLFGLSSKIVKF